MKNDLDKINNQNNELYDADFEDSTNEETIGEENNNDKIFALDVKLQELDATFERYEYALMEKDEEILSKEELEDLKIQYKDLRQKRKELLKNTKSSKWETIPIWLVIYSLFQIVFSLYLILMKVSLELSGLIFSLFLNFSEPGIWLFYVGYFFLPFIMLLASLIILIKLKDKFHKKFFAIVYLIHGIELIMSVILMIIGITRAI